MRRTTRFSRLWRLFYCLWDEPIDWQAVLAWVLIAIALISVAGLWPLRARGEQSDDLQSARLLEAAHAYYGGPAELDGIRPDLRIVDADVICAMMRRPQGCAFVALFDDQEIAVFLSADLDFSTEFAKSVLLHEYVHFLQYLMRGPVASCADLTEREHQAYLIQAHALENAGEFVYARGVAMTGRSIRC